MDFDYDFRVFDDPNEMRKAISQANQIQDQFVKYATWYDEWCDIMNTAIDET